MPVLVAYDPRWPAVFAAEATAIVRVLGELLTGPVEHIGSTSIPGIDAKPCIDMLAPVATLDHARRAGAPLASLGYVEHPHRADAVRFAKPDLDTVSAGSYHLHLTRTDSELWQERLTFRDAVRADDRLMREHAALKHRLLDASGGTVYDAADKREFVRRVLAGAGHQLRDGLHTDGRR